MSYPQTGTILTRNDGTNRTGLSLSTSIVVMVGPNAIGAIQEISFNEKRQVKMVDEVGTDGHVDSAPTKSADIDGGCTRIRIDRLRMSEAFSRGWLHVKSQRIPFDIVVIDKMNGDDNNALITTVKNVWMTGIDYTYTQSDFIISDRMTWTAEDIFTTLANGNAATGGERGLPFGKDVFEQAADRGARRGALDAPGLLQAFLPF